MMIVMRMYDGEYMDVYYVYIISEIIYEGMWHRFLLGLVFLLFSIRIANVSEKK